MALQELLGDKLLTAAGEKPTSEALEGATAVGLYFSAHWCPPCRGFTPKLATMYNDAFKAKGFKIVFVSSDKEALSKKFKVQGIPSFVILDVEGKIITADGRGAVTGDPEGANYPWVPPTKEEKAASALKLLGPELLEKAGGKPMGLYFSAHWCPPCRGFTPKLADFYNFGLKEKMEIIFVSSDKDQKSFNEYAGEMPWPALPFEKRAEKEKLSNFFGVEGIPSFIIINADGTVITEDGRGNVMNDPQGKNFPAGWLPKPFNDVNDDPSALNEEPCLLALGGEASMSAAVEAVAQEYYEKAGKDISAMPLRFFTAPDGDVVGQIRNLTKLDGNKLVFIDIPSDGAFYVCSKASPNAEDVKGFIADVLAGKAKRQQLQK